MPNWKKVVVSGSDALISHLTASGGIIANTVTGTVATATQATIDHDSLANFVANEHIDHSAVSVIAGTGLTGGGTIAANRTLNVIGGTGITANANDIAITAGGVDTTQLAADAVTGAKIADNAIDSEHYTDASIDTAHYAAGSVDATALGADSVTAAKIGDNVINSEHYAADSIDAEHYAAGSVDATALASNAVTTAKINADAVTGAKIVDNAINSEHYTDGSIDTAHIGDDQVTSAKLAHSIAIVTKITSPTSKIGLRDLDWAGNIAGSDVTVAQGDVIYHATTTATTAGNIYAMNTSGIVVPADADAVATASTVLCVALGANASLGLLLRGTVILRTSPGADPGQPIYLSTTAGNAQAAAPSGTGDVVRVLGYQLTPNGEEDQVNVCYFNPDNTWVELT